MSQSRPRRRKRRRKSGRAPSDQQGPQPAAAGAVAAGADSKARGKRRRGRRSKDSQPAKSSEDLVRSFAPPKVAELEGAGDDTTLEEVIGELQSAHGVPRYPQEFRIVIKVAEPGNGRSPRPEEPAALKTAPPPPPDAPRREKAPGLAGSLGDSEPEPEPVAGRAPARKRRRRRRRKSQ